MDGRGLLLWSTRLTTIMNRVDTSLRTDEAIKMLVTWKDPTTTRIRSERSRPKYAVIAPYCISISLLFELSICVMVESVVVTNLMSWNTGAFTTVGFRTWEAARHNDVTMNKTDGIIEKNSCSNWMLKSNCCSSSWRMLSCSGKNGIVVLLRSGTRPDSTTAAEDVSAL